MRMEISDPEARPRPARRVMLSDWVLGVCLLLGACLLLVAPISAPFLLSGH